MRIHASEDRNASRGMRLERGETWTKRIGRKTRGGNGGRRRGGDEIERTEKGCSIRPDTQAWECMHETNWKPSERRTRRNGERRMDGLTSCLHVRRNHGKKDTRTNTMASAEVIWGCVRNNSAFLRKGVNGTQFAAEPGNLTHRNSFKCSGKSNEHHDARTEHEKTADPTEQKIKKDAKKPGGKWERMLTNARTCPVQRQWWKSAKRTRACKQQNHRHRRGRGWTGNHQENWSCQQTQTVDVQHHRALQRKPDHQGSHETNCRIPRRLEEGRQDQSLGHLQIAAREKGQPYQVRLLQGAAIEYILKELYAACAKDSHSWVERDTSSYPPFHSSSCNWTCLCWVLPTRSHLHGRVCMMFRKVQLGAV